ncbi:DUF6920 family protein [Leptothrix discophora]|uniref:EF-hand domain-containing protein n=1 Tax=Leptothrix discophora TaxID=89 RepID=A0ABT9G8Q2_LEPDI|nr:DUF6544 family protein [Leptothrix discophora]MDP4302672.1 hypothetical protein [Leptothrix discophora]
MTVLLWVGIALAALVVLAIGLRALGATRWTELVRTHTTQLESGSVGAQGRLPSPARFDAHELEGLPPPVGRYFRQVLTDGQPIIAAARIEMTGTMNMSAAGEQWKPFTSRQRVVTRRPGFLWDAQVFMFPGLPAHVEDSYIAGNGRLIAKVAGLFTVADSQGEGEIARGEFMRYFAESPWYPTALLHSQGVRWEAVDNASARATLIDDPITLTLLFRFDDAGLIASVHAKARGAGAGKDEVMLMLPWDCAFSEYQRQGGMLVPMTGEAAWVRPAGRQVYFVGHVKTLSHEFLP